MCVKDILLEPQKEVESYQPIKFGKVQKEMHRVEGQYRYITGVKVRTDIHILIIAPVLSLMTLRKRTWIQSPTAQRTTDPDEMLTGIQQQKAKTGIQQLTRN
jgi:hypothetical protein